MGGADAAPDSDIASLVRDYKVGTVLLSTSTLYRALGRLEQQGHVERVPAGGEPAPGLPRKVYALTPQGRALLRAETRRVQRLADLARRYKIGDAA